MAPTAGVSVAIGSAGQAGLASAAAPAAQLAEAFGQLAEWLRAELACRAAVLAAVLPLRNAVQVLAVWPAELTDKLEGRGWLEADEGLLGLAREVLDGVVYANTATACSALARFFNLAGCPSALVVPFGGDGEGQVYVLAAGLTGARSKIADHLRRLLDLVNGREQAPGARRRRRPRPVA
jgi:hypothetical protein